MQPTWQNIIEATEQMTDARIGYWLNENLFTISWWILLVTTMGIFTTWLIISDKKRIIEIISYGLLVEVIALIADTIGVFLSLWDYSNSLTPVPQIIEIHTLQMPIIYMIIYQYFKTWKAFLIAAAIMAFAFALILEPLLVWLQIYKLYNWKHIYSLIPYFLVAVVLKWIINKLKQLDQNYQ